MIILARLIIGAAIGSISMIAPLYSKEIAQKSVRGTLGSFFQFLHTCGVLFAYGLGAVISNLTWISVICACVPLVAGALFLIFPDTPAWHLSYNNEEAAKDSLRYFRGSTEEYSNEQLEAELDRIREEVAQAKNSKNRDLKQTIAAFTTREAKMGIMLAMTLMLVQQLSGVSAVIFYAEQIFNDTKAPIPGDMASIVMGACLAGATFVSLFLVDKFGRKLLLLVSGIACIICNVILGVFLYYLKVDEKSVQPYSMVPIVTMSVFMILFSFGYGPIPWSYMTEVFTSDIQGTAISIATITNWLMVFIVTLFYAPLSNALGNYTTFWIFAGIVLLGTVIVALFLVETKGRESWEIQALLRGEKPQPRSNGVVRHDP